MLLGSTLEDGKENKQDSGGGSSWATTQLERNPQPAPQGAQGWGGPLELSPPYGPVMGCRLPWERSVDFRQISFLSPDSSTRGQISEGFCQLQS